MLRRLLRMLPAEQIEGYEHPDLIEAVFRKTLAYEPDAPWPEIGSPRTVLDFGGGCGLHYKQAQLRDVRWAVVETGAMVDRSRPLETDRLRFFTGIAEAMCWLGNIDLMHSNGALQYTPKPLLTLEQLCGLGARRMLWHRCFLSDDSVTERQVSRLQDNGPNTVGVKQATLSVERAAIPEAAFLRAHRGYSLDRRGPDWFDFNSIPQ
jgi:putative methyltransferase (TIGR04325 family)